MRYRKLRGSLHQGMRIERVGGLLSAIYANLKIKDAEYHPEDFMLHADRPEPTVEDAMQAWG